MKRQFSYCILFTLLSSTVTAQDRQMVDVGGYSLEALVVGEGSPVLVLLSGGRDPLDKWNLVIPHLSEHTKVVAYSRAGLGKSEVGGEMPRDVLTVARELKNLLTTLEIGGPFVLAGYSRGGIHTRIYASLYPEDIAGLIFVDASHEQQYLKWGKLDSTYWTNHIPSLRKNYSALGAAVESEWDNFIDIQREGRLPIDIILPDVPTAVISGLGPESSPGVSNSPEGRKIWRALHDEYYQSTTNGLRIISSRSGHQIVRTEPTLVADAMRWVIDRVRSSKN